MTGGAEPVRPDQIPTFSECVIGYRAWRADSDGRLWSLYSRRAPWEPGVNTARCTRSAMHRLALRWLWGERSQRVFGRGMNHAAPDPECACGLHSWRHPTERWREHPALCTPPRVVGAVASWGRIQVHADGFRAEHACVVALAYADGSPGSEWLERIVARYRVELVPLSGLERAASRHGSPLPEALRPSPCNRRGSGDMTSRL